MRFLDLRPDHAEAHGRLAALLHKERKLDEAIDHCRQSLRSNPDSLEAHSTLGMILLERGQLEESAVQLAEAARLAPDVAVTNYYCGHALFRQGKPEQAVPYYERAIKLEPKYVPALLDLASIRIMADPKLADLDEALALTTKACEVTQRRDPLALQDAGRRVRSARPVRRRRADGARGARRGPGHRRPVSGRQHRKNAEGLRRAAGQEAEALDFGFERIWRFRRFAFASFAIRYGLASRAGSGNRCGPCSISPRSPALVSRGSLAATDDRRLKLLTRCLLRRASSKSTVPPPSGTVAVSSVCDWSLYFGGSSSLAPAISGDMLPSLVNGDPSGMTYLLHVTLYSPTGAPFWPSLASSSYRPLWSVFA